MKKRARAVVIFARRNDFETRRSAYSTQNVDMNFVQTNHANGGFYPNTALSLSPSFSLSISLIKLIKSACHVKPKSSANIFGMDGIEVDSLLASPKGSATRR